MKDITLMESQILDLAHEHYKLKYPKNNSPSNTAIKEFWEDYFSGKPIYKRKCDEFN